MLEIMTAPDIVLVQSEAGWNAMRLEGLEWTWQDVAAFAERKGSELRIVLKAEKTAIARLVLTWNRRLPAGVRLLGDHWERSYGDLEWRGIVPERVMPWFFLLYDGTATHGFGVKTGPNALCFWQVAEDAIKLCLDVRCGGEGVALGGESLELASVISREGCEGESPFRAAREFCRIMCSNPILPRLPIYGGNNWYYAYGRSSHQEILDDAKRIVELSPGGFNRPYMVIDDGWQEQHEPGYNGGPWSRGNGRFPGMAALALEMKRLGALPGIWLRPLLTRRNVPAGWVLPEKRFLKTREGLSMLDPSVTDALELIKADIRQMKDWGYGLIKHDFTTYDLFGRWGFEMGGLVTNDSWSFSDRSKTTAQVVKGLYSAVREAAGEETLLLGCNTISHLAAGYFELQRTGDDTSGRQWERTRRMGINTLAFTLPKHGAFYAVDADCAAITPQVPWELSAQWLALLAGSGTPLFVSAAPEFLGPEQRKAVKEAFAIAAVENPVGEPLDWLDTTCPAKWRLLGEEMEFHWHRRDCLELAPG